MTGKRSIFEEVEQTGPAPAAAPPARDRGGARRAIRLWLYLLLLMVAVMIAVGGLTRLTDSGLSITEWKPVTGAIPPLSDADWQSEFAKYRATPEYQLQNRGMSLAEFKSIYWWEWGHRLLGRLIGLVWAAGFFGFLLARRIPPGWTGRLFLLGVLGGIQGALGWWMVSSGLVGRMVDVASYRLAMHLGLAFIIMGLILHYAHQLALTPEKLLQARRAREAGPLGLANVALAMVFVQVLLGALVAGIDAGRAFPTWPDMNGEFFPSNALDYTPLWSNFFENPGLVQFNHRIWGYLVLLFVLFARWRVRTSPRAATRTAFSWVAALVLLQVVLGIATAVTAATVSIAIVHQVMAIVVMAAIIRARFVAAFPTTGTLR